ncbi:hypothetical protein JRC04_05165 [Mycolicibacterium sp. S2-37]|uniref:dATP/dGTP diphosphohydrolase domain-containing protein n=1 Tax=Mycolicibacterium sp. S2-37 TaxID=2810297 RepID=UPI001A93C590|nr:dATP/dGTP diphosphohydrolase domain-containing protein [Mycolicibacterium sp. S2-37]MBO0676847.1 hypothetical protein [Mycolicibacterium sp. S2-37]
MADDTTTEANARQKPFGYTGVGGQGLVDSSIHPYLPGLGPYGPTLPSPTLPNWIGTPIDPPKTKETNPKDAVGIAKVPFSTVPAQVVAEVGLAMLEGALKYGRHNYRDAGVRASVYYDAVLRHLTAFWEGQDVDPDSGLSHLVKAIAGLVVLRDSQFRGNWTDDRPPKVEGDWVREFNQKAAALLKKYPDPLPAHTELGAE